MGKKATNRNVSALLLRIGLAIVFLYAAIASLRQPYEWTGYLPKFIFHVIDPTVAVRTLAVYEFLLAVWLLIGRFTKYAALLCAVTLAGILVINPKQLIITFRDIGLLFAAVALYFEKN